VTVGSFGEETDTGKKRRRNEDSHLVEPPLFAVADGMGGAQAGEVASRLAIAALRGAPGGVGDLIQRANRRVYERAAQDPAVSGMGTTMTLAIVEDGQVQIGHVGDSRAYRLRDGRLEQLTEDHSLVAELQRSGKLSAEEAETHPQRSVITRALGTDPDVDADTFTVPARAGDVFLLCSDGLTTMVDEDAILETIERNRGDLGRAAKELVRAANRGGGEDNITVVAFEIVGEVDDATQETVRLPAATAHAEDEDTLDETDAVPAVDTMVLSADEVRAMAEAQDGGPRRRGRRLLWTLLAVLVLAALAAVLAWRFLT
jgi:protein phosphatase